MAGTIATVTFAGMCPVAFANKANAAPTTVGTNVPRVERDCQADACGLRGGPRLAPVMTPRPGEVAADGGELEDLLEATTHGDAVAAGAGAAIRRAASICGARSGAASRC